jgi:molybdopterin molybdotransferase
MDGQVLEFEAAVSLVLGHASGVVATMREDAALLEARGRVLAEAVVAERDQPPFDRSTRDGFAVRSEELRAESELRVVGQVRAGEMWPGPALEALEAVEIMTGAPVPAGADAVVMVEHVDGLGGLVHADARRTLRAGDNIVRRGSEARAGQALLAAGTLVGAAEVALAAACGRARLAVYRRPRVAIVATGDELVELVEVPGEHQIRNSNSYALAALVVAAGGEAWRLPIARDEREAVRRAIETAREAELVVLSGGVSMGKYDLVETVLAEMGAEFFFTGVAMQPGRPVVFGRLPGGPYFFGLPGNPVSTQVTFHAFVEPMVRALAGAGAHGPEFVLAALAEDVAGKAGLTRLLPSFLKKAEVKLLEWQGSGDLAANARANCYVLLPGDKERFKAGEMVRVLLR